jgi:hypothetical protein
VDEPDRDLLLDLQCKVVSPNNFKDLTEVRDRLRAFEDRYNATAQPFQWKFTTSDLDDPLARRDRTHSTGRKNPRSRWQLDQPTKDFQS